MKIKYINHAIAYSCKYQNQKWLEINAQLERYPDLMEKIIEHELEHHNSKSWMEDIFIDFKDLFNVKKGFQVFLFMLRHPSAFTVFLPVTFSKWDNKLDVGFNTSAISFYVLVGVLIYVNMAVR